MSSLRTVFARFGKMVSPKREIFTTPSAIQFKSGVMQPTLVGSALPHLEKPLKQDIINICCLRNKRVLRQLKIVESLMKKSHYGSYGGVTFNFNEALEAVVYFYNEEDLSSRRDGSSLLDSIQSYLSRVPLGQNVLIVGNPSEERNLQTTEDLEKILNVASNVSVNEISSKSFNKIFVSKDSKKYLNDYFDRNEMMQSRIIFEDDIFTMLNTILQSKSPNQ